MSSASLESTLELWSTTLRQAKQRIRPLFAAPSVAASANAFLDGLLGGERRKTGWMRAEAAGDPGPWRQQAILGRTHWDAEALRDGITVAGVSSYLRGFGWESAMSSASLESTLELWSTTLRQAKQRIRPLFAAPSVAASANAFLDGLLGGERRKTGWMRAEAAGDPGPWRQQAILGRTHWDAEALRDVVCDYVVETLASSDAVLVIDETGFLKQGKASCGVGRQYTGSAGKITNCQIGVFAAYVSDQGHAFIDRRLYLPKAWTGDPARLRAAHVPEAVTFATKPRLALAMIERAVQAEVPFAWVAADSIYGVGEIELALRRAYKGYVLGVTGQHHFWSWDANLDVVGTAADIAKGISDQDWVRLSAGAGTKGPRLRL
ncbi:IS701 family transposase, partial [Methylorubrum populi]